MIAKNREGLKMREHFFLVNNLSDVVECRCYIFALQFRIRVKDPLEGIAASDHSQNSRDHDSRSSNHGLPTTDIGIHYYPIVHH